MNTDITFYFVIYFKSQPLVLSLESLVFSLELPGINNYF